MTWWKWNRETDECREYTDMYKADYLQRMMQIDSDFTDPVRFEANCRVGKYHMHGFYVSTVFLGLDHNFGGGGLPILFETVIWHDDYMRRYRTGKEALAGHNQIVRVIEFCFKAPMISRKRFSQILREF